MAGVNVPTRMTPDPLGQPLTHARANGGEELQLR